MKRIKTVAAAHALLGLAAGVPSEASAQQLTPPPHVERLIPDASDLQSSKVSHLGQLETKGQAFTTAIAAISHPSGSAGKIVVGEMAGAVERSALTTKSANTTVASVEAARTKEISFPEQTSKIAAHGSLAEAVPVLARTQPAAKTSTANSISREPFSIEPITN